MPRRKGITERDLDHIEAWVALALCAAVLVAALVQRLVPGRLAYAEVFAPDWIALPAAVLAGLAATATLRGNRPPSPPRRVLEWSGCLLMVWVSGGLLLDLLRVVGLWLPIMPLGVDWPGMVTRALALAAGVVLAHLTLFRPPRDSGGRAPSWFGWVAFALALPYPLLKTWWALGGTLGLSAAGVAGELAGSFALWLPSIPFLLAAALSLLLVPTWRRIPRGLLLTAGWVATAVTANVGLVSCWALVSGSPRPEDMATWVTPLFYGSWLLFAIAIGAATRSYQLRSAAPRQSETDLGQKGGERDGRKRNEERKANGGFRGEGRSRDDHNDESGS
jgi:hypothetical protein